MAHSGLSKERFTSNGYDQFDCLICCEVAQDPLECDACGKLFCSICIFDWLKRNTQCPNRCNSKIDVIKSKALIKFYNNLDIKCSNKMCEKVLKLGDLRTHEAICLKPKCCNFELCQKPQNEYFKRGKKPVCSQNCLTLNEIMDNFGNVKQMYRILSSLKPLDQIESKVGSEALISESLCWNKKNFGAGIVISQNNTHVYLKEQTYVFRSVVANKGFSSGINYWEIIADVRTENELKIGVTSNIAFDMNTAFCDSQFGWAYYGLGQLRHGSNATGAQYGKRFKKDGILGICLNMQKGTLSFSLNGESMGVAFEDEKLKSGTYYPAVSLLHCAGCKIRGGVPIPACHK